MKLQLILKLYDALVCGHTVVRAEFCNANGITERTFYRYMREIGNFLRVHKSDHIVDVVEFTGAYYLKCLSSSKQD